MNNIIKRKWNQNSMVIIEDLQGMAFQAESGGHTFQISGVDGEGNAVALSGTPAGVMLRADGQDVALTCSVSGGVVSATLPANAYVVPGRFGLTIFLTSDGQKTAIYAAVGTVGKTSSGTVAPPAGSDVVDLVNAIAAAVATIPASYTDLMAAMAPTYSSSGLYAVGSYAWYNGKLYRCATPITSGETWTSGHWTLANLGSDLVDLKSALSAVEKMTKTPEKINVTLTTNKYIATDGTVTNALYSSNRITNNIPVGNYHGAFITGSFDTGDTRLSVAFYASDNTFISGINIARKTGQTEVDDFFVPFPENASYFIIATLLIPSTPGYQKDIAVYYAYNIDDVALESGQLITSQSQLSDFNSAKINKIYVITTTGITNQPVAEYGTLATFYGKKSIDGGAVQLYATNTALYYRYKKFGSGTPWSSWYDLMKPLTSVMPLGSFVISSSQLADFNAAVPNTIYTIATTGLTNQPVSEYGTLVTLYGKTSADGGMIQIYSTNSKLFYRVKQFGSGTPWSEWKNLTGYEEESYSSFSMFENFGVVGDSFASGCIYTNGDEYHQDYKLSWGQMLARRCGNTCFNFSTSGVNTRTWLTSQYNCKDYLLSETPKQFYWLCLGINDLALGTSYIGSISDINDSDYNLNADTFYGNYGKIIAIIKEHAPNAKIVISTISYNGTGRSEFNTAIKALASHFNIPYVDQLSDPFFTSSFYTSTMVHYHPIAITYGGMAKAFERMFGVCVKNNSSYFADYLGVTN